MTDKLEIYIIEMPKAMDIKENNTELLDWLLFLHDPKSNKVVEKMKTNKELKQASDKLETLSQDEKMQVLADLRQRAIYEENTARKAGLKHGLEQGYKQASIKIAKKLLKQGHTITEVQNITELPKNILEQLQQELNS